MSIRELTPEQVLSMTAAEKDRWWLEHVYKGDMPQLNLRSGITGMFLGGILCLTNLYVGIRTGWSLGVGITSVIMSFAMFKALSKLKLGAEMSVLENNAMQSIATSAGYMTSPLVSSIAAYMAVTGKIIPWQHTMIWLIVLGILGVLFAFPLKKRFINDEQLPFPEGYAAGVVMDNLHTGSGEEGVFKAKLLAGGALASAAVETMGNAKVMSAARLGFLTLPEHWDDVVYRWFTPALMGTPLRDLTIQFDTSIVMIGTGGLMGMKTAVSLMLGAVINYFFLAPYFIKQGVIHGVGFKNITMWALWGGVAIMTTSSIYSFLSKPKLILQAFSGMFGAKKKGEEDVLKDIELPMWVFVVGIPLIGVLTVWAGHVFFDIKWWLGLVAIPLVFVFTLIAVNSTGITSITPIGALGKLTQLTFSGLAPGNVTTNIMTAGITGEVSSSAANLLMDIKPGYMLGGKPRHQAVGHVLGIFAGAIVSVPVFYTMLNGNLSVLMSDKLPMPSAQVWMAVAKILTQGFSFLHPTARWAILIGAIIGLAIEIANQKTQGRFPISGVGLGLAFVLTFSDSFAMFLGALLFWLAGKAFTDKASFGFRAFVDNQETVAAGVIAGGSIIGLVLIILQTVVLK